MVSGSCKRRTTFQAPFFGSWAERTGEWVDRDASSSTGFGDTGDSVVRIDPVGKRRNARESAMVRGALAQGYEVQFDTSDQWRYYHRQ